jgi:predicted O-methyltransferase YrrM
VTRKRSKSERLEEFIRGAAIIGGCLVIAAAVWSAGERLLPGRGPLIGVASISLSLFFVLQRWKNELTDLMTLTYQATQEAAAMSLVAPKDGYSQLPWSDWALAPDALARFFCASRLNNWNTIVECGSGVSTILLARDFKARGSGHVYAIEHDERWLTLMRQLLAERDLLSHATLVLAPLRDLQIDGQSFQWYEKSALRTVFELERIDALLVDGPPGDTCGLARYPALPMFLAQLGANSLVILDDGRRRDEKEIARRWAKRLQVEPVLVETTRGQWELQRGRTT